jgi:carboxypeptidase C (cathepsin A)
LKFGKDENYVVSAFGIEWDWKHKTPGEGGWMSPLPNTVPDLAMAMTHNPGLNVLVLQGYYDLATPYLATKNDIAHLDIPAEARKRVDIQYYDAGHMMYLHEPSMRKFRDDVAGFVRRTDRL